MSALQENTVVEDGHERKYAVGLILTFRGYDACEVATLGKDHSYTFKRGDKLKVLERNGCGMGIDVVRISDGRADMVWPTEVSVSRSQVWGRISR